MRLRSLLPGLALISVGVVWTLQGAGLLKGSFMTGQPFWGWAGVACLLAGVALLIGALIAKRSR